MLEFLKNVFGEDSDNDGLWRPERNSRRPRLREAPPGVVMKPIRPKATDSVKASLATHDGVIRAAEGDLYYRAGEHYLVRHDNGDVVPVWRRIFEHTYRRRLDGRYEKRRDILVSYFTLPFPAMIETLEGARRAEAGDWIVRGVIGELYPIAPKVAEAKYEEV